MQSWEEIERKANEQKQAREEAELQAMRDRAEKDRLKVEAQQAELNRLAERMFESHNELDKELAEEERRHSEAIQDIRTRNRVVYGIDKHNTTADEALKIFGKKLIENK